ncbi:Gfo/Idh/MocA family oxidoreductase [Sporolactobacillus shoreicorticis]|uniref:Gfo/Idh/MocA family protein n=1 Tax=Sporolactobacillus shoreicorticis TaxID=1923877 RepID=A0ABW5S629_9BACL|nr:Gfo/Idh/MocA family oxidoreductase [Sporolactobacillus shoreicorticis]MCO7128352.1 Gfo/Idh/MocA family oxidoreductase [Sporolactobacillus shoreicorticis]
MSALNWAIIGTGTIASEFADTLHQSGRSIFAVASRKLERAQNFANNHHIKKAYGNYDELLSNPAIDIVYIATPHSNHYELMIKCLENGKHILCEKSITVNSEQLNQVIQLAAEKQLKVIEAMTLYHMPLYQKLKDLIKDGKIGKLRMIQVSFGSLRVPDINSRFLSEKLAGGALLDIGVYALSFTRFFLNKQPDEILTTVKRFTTGVDEQSEIILRNSEDEMASIILTLFAKLPKRGIITGEKAYITVDTFPRAQSATITYPDFSTEIVTVGNTDEAMVYEYEYMNSVVNGEKEDTTLQLTLDVMQLMSEIRKKWGIVYSFENK